MTDSNPRSGKSLLGLALGLLFSAALLLGPHIAIIAYVPNHQPWMLVTYWMCMVTYLLASYVIEVNPDTSDLGLGATMIDNPFSHEDDYNRTMLQIALFLWPGKVVWWTIGRAWRVMRGG